MKKEKAAAQQMNREPAQRYQADISSGLSQEQVQERIDSGWTNEMVTEESKTVGQIIKGKTTMDIYAKIKYNKPEELSGVVNAAFHQATAG